MDVLNRFFSIFVGLDIQEKYKVFLIIFVKMRIVLFTNSTSYSIRNSLSDFLYSSTSKSTSIRQINLCKINPRCWYSKCLRNSSSLRAKYAHTKFTTFQEENKGKTTFPGKSETEPKPRNSSSFNFYSAPTPPPHTQTVAYRISTLL